MRRCPPCVVSLIVGSAFARAPIRSSPPTRTSAQTARTDRTTAGRSTSAPSVCYYFRTPNTASVAVQRWRLTLTGMVKSAHVFTTVSDVKTPGTVSSEDCGFTAGGTLSSWVASTDTPSAEITMPANDGAGKPVAYELPANTPGYILLHVANGTGGAGDAKATIDADFLAAGTDYTKTASFISLNANLQIPANTSNTVRCINGSVF